MIEQTGPLPNEWIAYARTVARDRNQPIYHRAVAANLLALGKRSADLHWLKEAIRYEFDPALLRAYLVALARVNGLVKVPTGGREKSPPLGQVQAVGGGPPPLARASFIR
jgi:hypothetical protein